MRRVWLGRRFGCATGLAAAAVIALLLGAPSAMAGKGGTTKYEYEIVGWSHEVSGQLFGSYKFPTPCVPQQTSNWSASVFGAPRSSFDEGSGGAFLKIGRRGSTGSVDAQQSIKYELRDSTYGEATACGPGGPTATSTERCTDDYASELTVVAEISAKTGDQLKINWSFGPRPGIARWVPNEFSCSDISFTFPTGPCKTKSSLDKFTGKALNLPYVCSAQESVSGTNTLFAGTQINGVVKLKRTSHN